ncbi:MAG: PAS domain S-box protein [Acidobacteria bacterium]|nr:PAS domain S-box protein [Acidobacteriota bacterium]
MRSIHSELKIRLAIALTIVSLGLLAAWFDFSRRSAADERVAHTLRVVASLDRVAYLSAELRSQVRDYLLTGNVTNLAPRDLTQATLQGELGRLRELTATRLAQTGKVRHLERRLMEKFDLQTNAIQTAKTHGLDTGRQLINSADARRELEELRKLTQEIQAEESRFLQSGQTASAEADKSTLWVMAAFSAIIVTVLFGAFFQVRRYLDVRLRSEENLSVTLRSIGDGVLATDANCRVMRMNPEAERLTGWKETDALGRPVDEVFHIVNELTRERMAVPVEKVLTTGMTSGLANHSILVSRDGGERPIADSAAPILSMDGRVLGVVLVFRDATAERQAMENEVLLRTISDNMPNGAVFQILQVERSLQCTYISSGIESLTGRCTRDWMAHPELLPEITLDEDRPAEEAAIHRALSSMAPLDLELRVRHTSGELRWLHVRAAPAERPDGAIQWDGVVVDITGKKMAEREVRLLNEQLEARVRRRTAELQAANAESEAEIAERTRVEEALSRAEERYRTVADFTYDWETWQGPDGGYLYVSPSCERITGYRPDDFVSDPGLLTRIAHLDDRSALRAHIQEMFSRKQRTGQLQFRVIARSGEERFIEHNCQAVYGQDGTWLGIRAGNRDVTERIRMEKERQALEEQYRQSQKLETVGLLAGGIAHDFNNLLTVINGYSDLMLREAAQGHPMHASLTQVRQAGERAADLTQQLLAFSRKQVIRPKTLDLNHIVADVEKMLRRVIGEDIELMIRQQPDLGKVTVDPGRITQVLMNLAVNARDAMPEGGRLVIETANVELDVNYCAEHPEVQPGKYVLLSVSDTGVGMEEAISCRIFEPFFTTKTVGRGSGLGLSTVHGIVKQAGGSIWVYSEPGHGSTFKIYLPGTETTAEAVETAPEPRILHGSETILVVEDQPELRELVKLILEGYGYEVLCAADAGEAIALSAGHGGSIDLLLTDVIMPGQTGRQLAERLSTERPTMRVIYMSGYAEDVVAHQGMVADGVRYIQKPFTPNELASSIRAALGLAEHV